MLLVHLCASVWMQWLTSCWHDLKMQIRFLSHGNGSTRSSRSINDRLKNNLTRDTIDPSTLLVNLHIAHVRELLVLAGGKAVGARSTSANFDFGQFFFSSSASSTSANFDFGQFRFRPISLQPISTSAYSTSANFWMLDFWIKIERKKKKKKTKKERKQFGWCNQYRNNGLCPPFGFQQIFMWSIAGRSPAMLNMKTC